ncbi:MAG: nucleotidyltransferase family protein [Actinomycetota bacterium]
MGERHGLTNIRVFGSVARGEADERSDLDLLVDPGPNASLFTLTAFALDVETVLHVFTQVATPNGLKSRIKERVLAEAVPL